MNINKINIIGAIAVAALLGVVLLAFVRPVTQKNSSNDLAFGAVSNTTAPAANTVLNDGLLLPNPSVLDYLVARTYLYSDNSVGFGNPTGVPINVESNRVVMTGATTTPCAVQSPFTTATSTANLSILITTGTSTASTLTIATSTTAFSTTTGAGLVTTETVPASTQFSANIDSGTSGYNMIVPPAGWVVVGAAGAAGGFTYVGSCSGLFTSIQ